MPSLSQVLRLALAAALVGTFASTKVQGAEIRISPQGHLILEGTIVLGDYGRLRSALLDANTSSDLFLASPGGDLAEAMKIGRLVRRMKLSTIAPSREQRSDFREKLIARKRLTHSQNYVCASACFFIFIAGIHREADFVGEANLGIHRPYLSKNDLSRLSGDEAIDVAISTRRSVETYTKAMGVPGKYLDRMFSVPGDQIDWIAEADFASDFDGFIPELKDWVGAQCDKRTDAEKQTYEEFKDRSPTQQPPAVRIVMREVMLKYEQQLKCERELRDKLALTAYRDELLRQPPSVAVPNASK